MHAASANSPGKVILFGEHSVVYGRPAIAAPVTQVRANALVEEAGTTGILLRAPDLDREYRLEDAGAKDPFARAVWVTLAAAEHKPPPGLIITINSSIPIASGLGSGAAMAAAVIRALLRYLGRDDLANDNSVSSLTYEVEKLLHGTPSGIDNTVVAYEQPVYFVKRSPDNLIETLSVARSIRLLVADTGKRSMTKDVVGDVRRQWMEDRARFERLFDACGRIADLARKAIQEGRIKKLGALMRDNQAYLREMTVSSPEIEQLVAAADEAGALGAKLSGAGRGGNMITLVDEATEAQIKQALLEAGAKSVITSLIG